MIEGLAESRLAASNEDEAVNEQWPHEPAGECFLDREAGADPRRRFDSAHAGLVGAAGTIDDDGLFAPIRLQGLVKRVSVGVL